jgi:hypothetical protein
MSAKKKAESFCNSVSVGDDTSDLREKGIASGARGKDTNWLEVGDSARQIKITYTGFYPGSDFICQIRERNGVVISKNPNIISSIL